MTSSPARPVAAQTAPCARRPGLRPLAASLLLVSLTLPHLARAQPKKPTAAEDSRSATRRQGDEAMKELRYSDALTAYRAAYEQTPDPVLLYNMSRALQSLERLPEALDNLEQFKLKAPPDVLARVPGLEKLLEQLRGRVSTLALQAEPAGARVMLRGTEIARAPVTRPLRVNAGPGRLEVLLEGYAPFERDLQLDPGASVEVKVALVAREAPAARPGTLLVKVKPEGATVLLDGAPIGVAPLEVPVEPGSHRLELSKPGYRSQSSALQIDSGGRRELDLTLARDTPSVLSRWWFWTGVGVVAIAGGTAVVYALTTDRNARQGSIEPGQLRNTLVRF